MVIVIFLGWIVLSFVVANMGSSKNIGGTGAFFISIIFSPLIGLLFVIASSPKKNVKKVNERVVELTIKALKKYKLKEYDEAITILEEALTIDPNEKQTHYNLSSIYSIKEQKEKSFFHLERAVELGYKNFSKISTSLDLKWLKEQSEFEEFMKNGYKFKNIQTNQNNYLDELKKLAELKTNGIINETEFEEQKEKILKSN